MNILHIVTWYTAYKSSVIREGIFHYEQAMELKKHHNVLLYYPFGHDLEKNVVSSEEHGLLIYRRKYRENKIFRIIDWITDLRKIIHTYDIQIIHAHVAGGAGIPAIIAGMIFRIPIIVTEHNPIQLSGLEYPKTKKRIEYVYSHSKKNLCVSPHLKDELEQIFPKINFDIMYNGVIAPQNFITNKMLYKREGYINCAIVAAFYDKEIKGFQFLLPALRDLKLRDEKFFLHICGGGEYLEHYQDMARQLGIEDNCLFYGQCEKSVVYNLMNQMDFIISASLFESAGVSVQEALLLGKPVLVTKSGGANSLVNDACGIVVDRGSVHALIDGMVEMKSKINLFDSKEIMTYAKNNFSIENITKKYIDIYRKILDTKRGV